MISQTKICIFFYVNYKSEISKPKIRERDNFTYERKNSNAHISFSRIYWC